MVAKKKKSTAKLPAATARRSVVGIKVKFEVMSKNRLRRVVFGLDKDTDGDKVTWVINFELYEREKKTDEFGDPLVNLDVEVETKLNDKANTVADRGLTPGQSAHLIGPAADDAKDADEDVAKDTIQDTLKKK